MPIEFYRLDPGDNLALRVGEDRYIVIQVSTGVDESEADPGVRDRQVPLPHDRPPPSVPIRVPIIDPGDTPDGMMNVIKESFSEVPRLRLEREAEPQRGPITVRLDFLDEPLDG
jgi:hypothetical protein